MTPKTAAAHVRLDRFFDTTRGDGGKDDADDAQRNGYDDNDSDAEQKKGVVAALPFARGRMTTPTNRPLSRFVGGRTTGVYDASSRDRREERTTSKEGRKSVGGCGCSVPLEFVGEIARAGAVREARHVQGGATARAHGDDSSGRGLSGWRGAAREGAGKGSGRRWAGWRLGRRKRKQGGDEKTKGGCGKAKPRQATPSLLVSKTFPWVRHSRHDASNRRADGQLQTKHDLARTLLIVPRHVSEVTAS